MPSDPGLRLIPRLDDWGAMRAAFRWPAPARYNMAHVCCDRWADADPTRTAILHVDASGGITTLSYGWLREASDRFANVLRGRGIARGDRIAVLLPQCPEVLVAHLAAYKVGAVAIPLFTLFGPDALAFRLSDSGARGVVTDAASLERLLPLRDDLPELAEIWVTGSGRVPPPARSLEADLASAASRVTPVDTAADDPAVLIYTSGTTGNPKGALHAHRFLLGHLPCIEVHHEGFPRPGDIGWTPADWAWIGGLMDMAMPCLHSGVPLVSHRMRKFEPDRAFALVRDLGVRNLFLPPTALKLMRQEPAPTGLSVRTIGSGGESLGADLLDWGRAAFGVTINEFYGQTECNLVVSACSAVMDTPPGAMGRAVPGHEVAVIDADGRPLAPGETGEIAVRAPDPAMFLRYWNQPGKTREKFVGGWMRTGDLGTCDDEGYFRYVSRDDDVITSAGYRIGPTEIENCLTGDPDVVMAAAVGVPDPVRTEIVKAYVVLREGAAWEGLEARLIARVRERVSPHVAPRVIERIDALPMTATGKIIRRDLRARG